jgi:hypothetical protein
MRVMRAMRHLRSSERLAHPELFRDARDKVGSTAGEYRSRLTFLGVPLVHCRFSSPDEGQPPVFGWIAGGDRAYGLLMAWGGYAVAPISLGAVSVGFISLGNFSVGLFSFGTVALGWIAVGCASIGYDAYAWLSALGWDTAQCGGFGIAGRAALAPVAFAARINDDARAILTSPGSQDHQMAVITTLTLLSLLPLVFYARAVRKRMGKG